MKIIFSPGVIWDYKIEKPNLKDPAFAKWYLKRKLDFYDWRGIKYDLLKKYFKELDLEPGLKRLLGNFIKQREKSKRK